MNILSLFVLIPLLMMLGLWMARSVNQVRGVMVAGSSALLVLAVWLAVDYLRLRALIANLPFPQPEMLYTDSVVWYVPLHICYSVGVDGISVVMLLLSASSCSRHFRFMETETPHERIFSCGFTLCSPRACSVSSSPPTFHHVHVL